MYQFFRSGAKKLVPNQYHTLAANFSSLFEFYGKRSYSQEGEDLIVKSLFHFDYAGFYVDVGAYHPMEHSNTYYFHKRGWRGINIDAMPGSMRLFKQYRKTDTNLEIAISAQNETKTFYEFDTPTLNTLSEEHKAEALKSGRHRLVNQVAIQTRTLASVLDDWLPPGTGD